MDNQLAKLSGLRFSDLRFSDDLIRGRGVGVDVAVGAERAKRAASCAAAILMAFKGRDAWEGMRRGGDGGKGNQHLIK